VKSLAPLRTNTAKECAGSYGRPGPNEAPNPQSSGPDEEPP
jgi:hypothetical protein